VSAPVSEYELCLDDLRGIAEQTWDSYLNVDGSSPLLEVAELTTTEVVASVSVTGAWDGHVVVRFSRQAAVDIAAALLDLDTDDVDTADIVDAAGELANVVGGNVKSLLPQPGLLSLPHVVVGDGLSGHWLGTVAVCELAANWRGEPIVISVLRVDLS
jgi:chemotaxis protein CheX